MRNNGGRRKRKATSASTKKPKPEKKPKKQSSAPLGSPIAWIGGKRSLRNVILVRIPPHKKYVEPFVGGGTVFFGKDTADVSVINDLNPDIANLYQTIPHMSPKDFQKYDFTLTDRRFFQVKQSRPRSPRGQALRFMYLNKRSFSSHGGTPNHAEKDKVRKDQMHRLKTFLTNYDRYTIKLDGTEITNEDFRAIIGKHDGKKTLIYLDPPYHKTYQGHSYAPGSKNIDPREICAIAKTAKGMVLLSYNDHPEVREACRGLKIQEVEALYMSANAGNVDGRPRRKTELLIANFDMEKVRRLNIKNAHNSDQCRRFGGKWDKNRQACRVQ